MNKKQNYKLTSAILAFTLWGAWAYYANQTAPIFSRLVSSFTQGIASFIITLVMVQLVTWLYTHLKHNRFKLILPALITVSLTGSCLTALHYAVGTQHIFYTISPALTVAFLFCLFTAYQLDKGSI